MTDSTHDPEPRVRAQIHVISAEHGDRTVLLDARAERYFSLNVTGRVVWDLLCDGTTRSRIISDLASRYGGDIGTITVDVNMLIEKLINSGLVVEHE